MVRSKTIKLKLFLYSALYVFLRNRNQRRYWVHPTHLARKRSGEYFKLVKLLDQYPEKYFSYFRMSKRHFEYIYNTISSEIKPATNGFRRDIITAKEKLVITLRFLATGCSFSDLSLRFLMGRSTIEKCIFQTIRAINKYLLSIALPKLKSDDWSRIANEFFERWNFPNCLGAVDGKHIDTFAPNNSGSKKRFSTVLMAVVDARYKFISVDIGAYGSNSNSAIFKNSEFGHLFLNNPEKLNIPDEACLPSSNIKAPHVLVGDEAFSLKPTLLTPYPGENLTQNCRIFNYRLSRARKIVENAFGILVNKWRILLKRLEVKHRETMNEIVMTCVILHNIIKSNVDSLNNLGNDVNETYPTYARGSNWSTVPASRGYDIRELFADWCIKEGDVSFQYNMI